MDQSMFLRKMFEGGAAQMADGIGTHPTRRPRSPGRIVDQLRARLGDLRETMGEFGSPRHAAVGDRGGRLHGRQGQAELESTGKALADIYGRSAGCDRCRRSYSTASSPAPASGDREPGFGVFDRKGHRKAAFCTVARAVGRPCG